LEEDEFYAIALDKNLRPVRSITSNVGHLLFADLLCEERVDEVIERLFSEDLFSGYGIRTMGMSSTGYNPQSYHNGSVWPHDNGLILLGLNNYKRKEAIEVLIDGLLRASKFFKMNRLPELFCGYSSALGYPISYPTTCSPQAWAAATTFSLLQGMLGLRVDGLKSLIYISPTLPKRVCLFKVKQLFIGKGYVDLRIVRGSGRYVLSIINNTTGYKIIHEE